MKKSTSKAKAQRSSSKATGKASSGASKKTFDISLVEEFTQFMNANGLAELEIRADGREIRLRRFEGAGPAVAPAAHMAPSPVIALPAPSAPAAPAPLESSRKYHIITSPFVGTFYRSPGPNQDAFVEVGQTVNAGDSLCIIEAMKLMNPIESDMRGRVVKIFVNNATPVEFGEALFEIDPL